MQYSLPVEVWRAAPELDINLFDDVWSFALDQRAFGPRRVLVAFADAAGRLTGLAHSARVDPITASLAVCLAHGADLGVAAVVYSDEPVTWRLPEPTLVERLDVARAMCDDVDVDLIDWIMCDDDVFRSLRYSSDTGDPAA